MVVRRIMERGGGDQRQSQSRARKHQYPPRTHNNSSSGLIPQTVVDRSAALALAKLSSNSFHNNINNNNSHSHSSNSPSKRYLGSGSGPSEESSAGGLPPNRNLLFNHKHLQYVPPPKRSPSALTGSGSGIIMTNGRSPHLQHQHHHQQLYHPPQVSPGRSISAGQGQSQGHAQVNHDHSRGNGPPLTKSVGVGANLNYPRGQQQSNRSGATQAQAPSLITNASELTFRNV